MSDTPRTDAVKIRCGFQAVPEQMLQHACDLERENADHGLTIATIRDIVTDDNRSNKAKVLAIGYVLRKEAQP